MCETYVHFIVNNVTVQSVLFLFPHLIMKNTFKSIFLKHSKKRKLPCKDLQELENHFSPKYCDIVNIVISKIPIQRKDLNRNSQTLKAVINKQGHDLHRAVDSVIQ